MATLREKFSTEVDEDKSKFYQPQAQLNSSDLNNCYHIVKQCYQSVPKSKSSHRRRCCTTPCSIAQPTLCLLLLPQWLRTRSTNIYCVPSSAAIWRWRWLIVACMLVLQTTVMSAAPQSCILCDKNDLIAKDPHTNNYEEFLFEHQVTRQDAINALKQLNESFYDGVQSDSSCNAVRCTDKVNKYCLGPQFINDHCWCEFGHSTEGLPFVPHICYVGEKVYKASVGSCFFYEEVKECCCSSLLAKEWRHISSASSFHRNSQIFYNYFLFVIAFLYLLIRRLHF